MNPIPRRPGFFAVVARYLMNVALSLDQLVNTLAAGDPDETVSSRLGRLRRCPQCGIPWSRPVSRTLDSLLNRIDRNHTTDAIEHDEGDEGLLDRPSRQKPKYGCNHDNPKE